jgi:hypothetical protein
VEDGVDHGPTVSIKESIGKAADHHTTKPGLLDELVRFRVAGDMIQSSFDGALDRPGRLRASVQQRGIRQWQFG